MFCHFCDSTKDQGAFAILDTGFHMVISGLKINLKTSELILMGVGC